MAWACYHGGIAASKKGRGNAIMKTDTPALIVARPGHLRDAWRALLMATPLIGQVHQAGDAPSALGLLESIAPRLVLLDSDMGEGGPWTLVQQIKADHPESRSVVLVCNLQEQSQAEAAGADVVLLRGFPAEKLFQAIEDLLHRQDSMVDTLDDVAV
jgi:DNA-binding NarL/FixJ family response regulator